MEHTPDFSLFLQMLRRKPTPRPVLFELFMDDSVYETLAGHPAEGNDLLSMMKLTVDAYAAAGYDYASVYACGMGFVENKHQEGASTISLNADSGLTDREAFERYPWPDPDSFDYSPLEQIQSYLPEGMKLMILGPGGVLENVTWMVGYDNLCYMLYEDPALVQDIFDAVGSRLVRYYERAVSYDSVGMLMSNDDWGFNTQTFLSPEDMRRYVFPWHRRIVETAHRAGKPCLLHSCGQLDAVMEDVIEMGYDGKHSFEDNILPVEKAIRLWGDRIAILGGVDMDFLVRSPEEEIRRRCENLLFQTREKGGYALGSGNSIPAYVPMEKFRVLREVGRQYPAAESGNVQK